ncbi:hypothetical protein ACC680_28910 [Rhizobium ruizarguesonis]|nr:hypothetical protein [Rhizobium ruizarguesonis]
MNVCAFMGDDASAQRVLRMLDNLDDVINRRLPRSLGTFRDEEDD